MLSTGSLDRSNKLENQPKTNFKLVHFRVEELVDKKTFLSYGDSAVLFLSFSALKALEGLREFLGVPLIVNTWHRGGVFEFSGYRPIDCPIGSRHSQHRTGNAFDVKPRGMSIEDAYNKILADKDNPLLTHITRIEDIKYTPTWIHIDCKDVGEGERIKIIKP